MQHFKTKQTYHEKKTPIKFPERKLFSCRLCVENGIHGLKKKFDSIWILINFVNPFDDYS